MNRGINLFKDFTALNVPESFYRCWAHYCCDLSETTRLMLNSKCSQLIADGMSFEVAQHNMVEEQLRIMKSLELLNTVLPVRNSCWGFLSGCFIDCRRGARSSFNLQRLVGRIIEALYDEANALGVDFYAYPGIKEDVVRRLGRIFKKPCPNRFKTYQWYGLISQLKRYIAWKLSNERTGFPVMPGEELPIRASSSKCLPNAIEAFFAYRS